MNEAITEALGSPPPDWLARIDTFLGQTSWDVTWTEMRVCMDAAIFARRPALRRPVREVGRLA
jgi:hypothetical protein